MDKWDNFGTNHETYTQSSWLDVALQAEITADTFVAICDELATQNHFLSVTITYDEECI